MLDAHSASARNVRISDQQLKVQDRQRNYCTGPMGTAVGASRRGYGLFPAPASTRKRSSSSSLTCSTQRRLASVAERCHPLPMEVTQSDVVGIPVGNVRVPRQVFVAQWQAASARDAEQAAQGVTDWYAGAVALTCRWMAAAPTRTRRGGGLTRSPATRRRALAYEELIEEEFLAAQDLEQRRPDLASRPGWCDGVRATLRWAWRAEGPPPLKLPATAHGDMIDHTSA